MQRMLSVLLPIFAGAIALAHPHLPLTAAPLIYSERAQVSTERIQFEAAGPAPAEPAASGRAASVEADQGGNDSAPPEEEVYSDISLRNVSRAPRLPLSEGSGPSVAHVQILLDRVDFSPGILDGHWGMNTEKALYWFQSAQGLERSGVVDHATYRRLHEAAGAPVSLTRRYMLLAEDLEGPFLPLPANVYERASLQRLVYDSPLEMLSERFHIHPELLQQLNPEVDFDALGAGMTLEVPDVTVVIEDPDTPDLVASIRISKDGLHLHAKDIDGRVLFHFPVTLGEAYDLERFAHQHVTAVVYEPDFRYQPRLHAGEPGPDAILPPGPNSPVGLVWIELEAPGYGIHGTPSPRTIGYDKSLGCVRLTNWDATLLANHTAIGTPVEFH